MDHMHDQCAISMTASNVLELVRVCSTADAECMCIPANADSTQCEAVATHILVSAYTRHWLQAGAKQPQANTQIHATSGKGEAP